MLNHLTLIFVAMNNELSGTVTKLFYLSLDWYNSSSSKYFINAAGHDDICDLILDSRRACIVVLTKIASLPAVPATYRILSDTEKKSKK